jgi:hypothetical protein
MDFVEMEGVMCWWKMVRLLMYLQSPVHPPWGTRGLQKEVKWVEFSLSLSHSLSSRELKGLIAC